MQAWIAKTQNELQGALRAGAETVYIDGMLTIRPPDEGGYPDRITSVLDVWHRDKDLEIVGMGPGSGARATTCGV